MFCLESFLPLRAGSFCSSRFLLRLNRDELCRRSFFTIWGPPEYLILLSWVGGGVLLLGRLLAVCWAWREKNTTMFRIKMGTLCRSMPWHHFWSQKVSRQCLPDGKHNRRDKIQRPKRKKAILLIRCRGHTHSGKHFIGEIFGYTHQCQMSHRYFCSAFLEEKDYTF